MAQQPRHYSLVASTRNVSRRLTTKTFRSTDKAFRCFCNPTARIEAKFTTCLPQYQNDIVKNLRAIEESMRRRWYTCSSDKFQQYSVHLTVFGCEMERNWPYDTNDHSRGPSVFNKNQMVFAGIRGDRVHKRGHQKHVGRRASILCQSVFIHIFPTSLSLLYTLFH